MLLFIILIFVVVGLVFLNRIENLLTVVLENQKTMFSIMHRVDNATDELLRESEEK